MEQLALTFWDTLKAAGPEGVLVSLLVLVFVYTGEFTDVFKGGTIKRWAAWVSSILFAGVRPGDEQAAVVAAIGIALSTLAHFGINALQSELNKRKAKG